MIIKTILTVPLVILMFYVVVQQVSGNGLRWAVLISLGIGTSLVWFDSITAKIANLIGVGRGADLLMYLWVVVTLAILLLFYLRIVQLQRNITILTRQIALSSPFYPKQRGE
jgi:small membrane protein